MLILKLIKKKLSYKPLKNSLQKICVLKFAPYFSFIN